MRPACFQVELRMHRDVHGLAHLGNVAALDALRDLDGLHNGHRLKKFITV
jgi:hypothetical protein